MKELFPYIKNNNTLKKAWLDYLYYEIGNQKYNYLLCSLYKDKEGNSFSSKWKNYLEIVAPLNEKQHWKLKNINQRQVLPNEVVLDLEEKETLKEIIKKLEERKLKFYVFDTNSRGYHISIFFDKKLSKKRKSVLIQFFNADDGKSSDKTMIALEFTEHWKSGKKKELIYYHV